MIATAPSVVLWWAALAIFVGTPACFVVAALEERGLLPSGRVADSVTVALVAALLLFTGVGWLLAFGVGVGT